MSPLEQTSSSYDTPNNNIEDDQKKLTEQEIKNLKEEIIKNNDRLLTISHQEFLSIYPSKESRLQALCGVSTVDVGSQFTCDFGFGTGVENNQLFVDTTAGQILPTSVGTVEVDGVEYKREKLEGEFRGPDNERLKIYTGTELTITEVRSEKELEKMEKETQNTVEAAIVKLGLESESDIAIAQGAAERGFNVNLLLGVLSTLFGKIFNTLHGVERDAAIEEAFTDIDRKGDYLTPIQRQLNLLYSNNPENWRNIALEKGIEQSEIDTFADILLSSSQHDGFDKTLLPEQEANIEGYKATAREIALQMGIPPEIFLTLVLRESAWDPKIRNPDSGAYGLTQIIDETWSRPGIGLGLDRENPTDQLWAGANYLLLIIKKNNCTWAEATAYYNTGENFDKDSNDLVRLSYALGNRKTIVWKIPGLENVTHEDIKKGRVKVTKKQYFDAAVKYYSGTE